MNDTERARTFDDSRTYCRYRRSIIRRVTFIGELLSAASMIYYISINHSFSLHNIYDCCQHGRGQWQGRAGRANKQIAPNATAKPLSFHRDWSIGRIDGHWVVCTATTCLGQRRKIAETGRERAIYIYIYIYIYIWGEGVGRRYVDQLFQYRTRQEHLFLSNACSVITCCQ